MQCIPLNHFMEFVLILNFLGGDAGVAEQFGLATVGDADSFDVLLVEFAGTEHMINN